MQHPARAQTGEAGSSTRGSHVLLRVRVTDSAGTPIPGVDVAVSDSGRHILAQRNTATDGTANLVFRRIAGRVQVSARRLGYGPAQQNVSVTAVDTLSLLFRLTPAAASIAPVVVSADEDLKRKSYFVDSAQIAHSHRLILNGMDVLTKMRPDILTGRAPGCGLRNIFVNGVRIVYPPLNAIAVAHVPRVGRANAAGELVDPSELDRDQIWSVMWSIRAQDIKEMTYKDCLDTSMPGVHGSSALYIVLRPGIAFDPGRGTYPADSIKRR